MPTHNAQNHPTGIMTHGDYKVFTISQISVETLLHEEISEIILNQGLPQEQKRLIAWALGTLEKFTKSRHLHF